VTFIPDVRNTFDKSDVAVTAGGLLATAWTVYYNFVMCRPFSHRLVGERGRSESMLYGSLLP